MLRLWLKKISIILLNARSDEYRERVSGWPTSRIDEPWAEAYVRPTFTVEPLKRVVHATLPLTSLSLSRKIPARRLSAISSRPRMLQDQVTQTVRPKSRKAHSRHHPRTGVFDASIPCDLKLYTQKLLPGGYPGNSFICSRAPNSKRVLPVFFQGVSSGSIPLYNAPSFPSLGAFAFRRHRANKD